VLPLSKRAWRVVFEYLKVKTLGELCAFAPREVLKFRNCGVQTIVEIQGHLLRQGLSLKIPPLRLCAAYEALGLVRGR
jgi:hypothetical protein